MNVKPDPVYDSRLTFDGDETITVKVTEASTINIVSGRASFHMGRDGISKLDRPYYYEPTDEHDGFFTLTTTTGMTLFLSLEQAHAIAAAVRETSEIGLSAKEEHTHGHRALCTSDDPNNHQGDTCPIHEGGDS